MLQINSENMASLKLVNVEEVSKFIQRCMCCVGTNPEHSRQLAELLVAADCRGHFSHGLNRLGEVFILYFSEFRLSITNFKQNTSTWLY